MKSRALLIVALEQELPTTGLADWTILYTGVGKVNAAINLMAALTEKKPDLLINYGTAGAIKTGLADIVEVGQSVQCGMDARLLGISLSTTPFETGTKRFTLSDSFLIYGTADRFMISAPEPACDLVDMELHALAMIAKSEHIPLKYFNFISDNADDSSHQDWKKAFQMQRQDFSIYRMTCLAFEANNLILNKKVRLNKPGKPLTMCKECKKIGKVIRNWALTSPALLHLRILDVSLV